MNAPTPSFGSGSRPYRGANRNQNPGWALYRLFLRSQVTPGRLIALCALGFVGVLLGLGIGLSDPIDSLGRGVRLVDGFGLVLLAPITSLVFASSALGDMVDDETLVYLWLRPVSRLGIAGAAAAASLTVCLPLVTVSLVAAAALTGGGAELVGATALASIVAVVGYVGLFTALGLRFKRALVWGIAYILLWEGFVATAGATASKLALRAYTRSVVSDATSVGLDLADLPLVAGAVVPVVVAVIALAYTARRLDHHDIS